VLIKEEIFCLCSAESSLMIDEYLARFLMLSESHLGRR